MTNTSAKPDGDSEKYGVSPAEMVEAPPPPEPELSPSEDKN